MPNMCLTHEKAEDAKCINNGLQLRGKIKEIKEQNLQLTELEGALIAIYHIIIFPIEENSIMNTLDQLPRTPQAAGLIEVALKRKTEFQLAPMGVLTSGTAHARPSAEPPIATSGKLSVHVSGRGGQQI
jgi:hypothetical protein